MAKVKGSLSDYDTAQQTFVMLVSLFSHQRGLVMHRQPMENRHISEQHLVQKLLATLHLKGAVVTADALHCPKNGFVPAPATGTLSAVKANQPTLFAWLGPVSEAPEPMPCDVAQRQERSHGRWVHRRVSVYDHQGNWPTQWPGLRRWLCVERWGYREG